MKIPEFFTRKSLSSDLPLYILARNRTFRSDVDRLALRNQLLNLFCIVYYLFRKKYIRSDNSLMVGTKVTLNELATKARNSYCNFQISANKSYND